MNAIELLKQDHRAVEDLFSRLSNTDDADQKEALFLQIAQVLTIHTVVEEQRFYPVIREKNSEKMLKSFFQDHGAVKQKIARILDLDAAEEAFDQEVERLRQEVEAHVLEEETVLFTLVRATFTPEHLELLGEELASTREALSELEPREFVDTENVYQPY